MDRTTAACAGLAINSMFADAGDWGEMVVQIVRTGDYWHVEVRRGGDVYANERGDNRVDVTEAPSTASPARIAADDLEGIADKVSRIVTPHLADQDALDEVEAALRELAAGVRAGGEQG